MACTGAHCDNHGTGLTTCVGHQPACPANRPLAPSGAFGVEGETVTAADINDLRIKIRDELSRYNTRYGPFTFYQGVAYAPGTAFDNVQINELENMTHQVLGGVPPVYDDATVIDNQHWLDLAARYNAIRVNCVCNTDCSCNNVCVCHNDCGCNYSDMRLKKDIVYC